MKNQLFERITRFFAPPTRITAMLFTLCALCATTSAWAANGNGTLNYEITSTSSDGSELYTVVIDNRIDKRISSSAAFGTSSSFSDFTLSNPTLTIPATDSLPSGTKIKVTQIEFCRNSKDDDSYEAKYVQINGVTSDAKVIGGGYSSSIGIGVNGNSGSGTGVKITYAFTQSLEINVGTAYAVAFLNDSSQSRSSVRYCYVSNTGTGSPAAQSLLDLDGSHKVLFKLTGTVEYTFNANSANLNLADGANWASGAAPTISSPNVKFNVTADTTVNVAADTTYGKVTIAGDHKLAFSGSSISASSGFYLKDTVTFAPGMTISSAVNIDATATAIANGGEGIYVSNFKGAGTIIFDGVVPSEAAAASSTVTASATDSNNWTGTLWLKNYNTDQSTSGYGLYMPYWGNVNSKIKFTNVAGYLPCKQGNNQYLGYDDSELGEWVLEDEEVNGVTKYAFTKTNGFSGYWIRFKKLSGSGTMAEKSGATQTPQVRIADGSEFTGTLKLDQGMRVAFSDSDVSINAKQIVIASGEEVTASTAWTTDGFVVNGTLNLNATPSGKVVGGSGTVNLGSLSVANGISEFASAAAWTGKVVVPSITTGSNLSIGFNSLGNSGSTVILKGVGFTGNYPAVYPAEAGTGATVNPTLQIDGQVTFTWGHSSEYVTSFSRITGTGNLDFDPCNGDCTYKYKINTLEGYTGLLGVYNDGTYKMQLEIGTLALDSMPTTSDRIVKIKTASNWGNIVNVANTSITVGGEATEYKLVKKNVGTSTAGLYLAPAVIKSSDGTLTPYESVDAAFTALSSLENDAYDYMAVYDSATVTYSNSYKTPKIKTIGDGVTLTLNSGYGDFGWVAGSPGEDGVVTYSFGSIPATYTWVGAENASWFATTSWQCGGDAANRPIGATDNAIFSSEASVTISGNYPVASITNSANVTFTAASAQTITVGDGGVVMTALGNSITLTNVTLSKVPTTTAATLAVQTTGGGEDPTVYTVVNSVASVDGVGYATMAEASEALKTSTDTRIILQQDYDGTVTIYPGKYLVQNGHTVTSVIGAATDDTTDDGIVVTRSGNSVANYYWSCVDQRTATWSGAGSAYWTVMGNWVEQFTPTTYTAVTIPATEGHATAITLSGDVSIKSLTLCAGETLTLSRSGDTARTLTTSQAIVLTSGQSIVTNPGVTISPAITTEDANSYVKSVTSDGATTYTVAAHKATVYDSEDAEVKKYDSLVDAFAAATDGQKITLFANSNDAITLSDKSITFNEGSFTFTGSFTGNGTVRLTSTLKSAATARWAEGWTGTVVLPAGALSSPLNFNLYGISGSLVQITGDVSGYLPNAEIVTTVKIPVGASLTLTAFSPSFVNTFDKIVGEGTLSVPVEATTGASGNDLGNAANWGAGYNYSAYLLIKDVSQFTGSLAADQAAGIAIGAKPHKNTVGGKIIVDSGASATIASGKTWSAVNGIVVDGTLDVAGTVTDSIAGGTGNGAKTLNVNSGATISMGSGKTISGLTAVNLKGGSVDLGTLAAATTQKYVAVSGESTLTLECEYNSGSGVIFNGDTIESPFIKVESGATLNLSYGNFSGWNGNVCDGYIVNEGTLNISQKGSVSTFFRNHLILTDGCTTTIGGTGKLSLYGGVATESTAQIQLVSGAAEISSASAGIGFGNVSNSGGYGGKGVGITVGDNATLTISAQIYASSVSSGSNPVAKYGNGTLVLSHASNSAVETWTLNAGVIKSVVALTVNSGDGSKRVSDVSADGYHVYSLVPSPAEVTTTTFSFNSFTYGGQPVSLGEGDTIIVPSDCTGDQWNPTLTSAADHPVIVRKDMNWKAAIGTMTIDSGKTVYGYKDNGTSLASGASISGAGTFSLDKQVTVSGETSITCAFAGNGSFSLADGATLTVASELAEGKVTTSVAGKCVRYNSETTTYSLVFEATTTGVEITAADAGAAIAAAAVSLTSAQKEQGLEESYYKLVATAGESGKWIVKAELDEDVVGVAFTAAPALTASASTCTATFTLSSGTKKGLYYGIATVSDPAEENPEVTVIAEAKANSNNQTIELTPNIDFGSGNVIYYRWSVSDSQRITPPDPEP